MRLLFCLKIVLYCFIVVKKRIYMIIYYVGKKDKTWNVR
jgi:hypothetical protein